MQWHKAAAVSGRDGGGAKRRLPIYLLFRRGCAILVCYLTWYNNDIVIVYPRIDFDNSVSIT